MIKRASVGHRQQGKATERSLVVRADADSLGMTRKIEEQRQMEA
jgi:hypothetical protein